MTDITPSTIGRYHVVSRIARGGMGTLYLGWDPKLDRQIAIKILTDDNDELRERFAREARSVARLHHPHIVTIFDVGESDGRPFIAMEYIQGETLATVVQKRLPLTTARKLEIIEELCEGLAFAHKNGIVHRDIKPANLMLEPNGSLKILDFGIARADQASTMTSAGMLIGTLNYMSPEQVAGGGADSRSDIYAVGAVMYELLSYRQAFPGSLADGILNRLLNNSPEPLERLCPGLDPEIPRIVARALEKSAGNRYQDLGAMFIDVRSTRGRLPAENVEPDTIGTTVNLHRGAITTPVPVVTPAPGDSSRRPLDRDEIARRRAKRIEAHVESAERAFAAGDYDAGIGECEQALMLDADNVKVLELLDRGRAALDERRAAEILTDAEDEIRRGALTSALAKIDRAAALHATSARVAELRATLEEARAARERARQRAQTIHAIMERGHATFDVGSFHEAIAAADEALALDPDLADAKALKAESLEAIAAYEREVLDRRARATVRDARRLFAADERAASIDLLAGFDAPHELISQTLDELRAESARLDAQRQLEAEQRARRERVAAALSDVRDDIGTENFASALDRLRALQKAEGSSPEIGSLTSDAEAGLSSQQQAAKTAKEVAAHIARAAVLLARQDLPAALTSIDAALAMDPAHEDARSLRSTIEDRIRAAAELREAEERRERERAQAVAAAIAKAKRATSHEDAISALGEALHLNPDHTEARQLLDARQNALRRQQAEHQRAQELETARQAQVQQGLVAARDALRRGDMKAARKATGRIRKLDPDNQDVRSLLHDIELAEEARRNEPTRVVSEHQLDAGRVPRDSDNALRARDKLATGSPLAQPAPGSTGGIEPAQPMAAQLPTPSATESKAPALQGRGTTKSRSAYPMLAGVAGVVVVAVIGYLLLGRGPAPPAPRGDSAGQTAAPSAGSLSNQKGATPPGASATPSSPDAAQNAPVAAVPPPPPPPLPDPAASQNARVERDVERLRTLAQDQFARGERQQALQSMKSALKLRPDHPRLKTLLNDALTEARAELRRSHDAATAAGEAARRSSNYREGTRREVEAERFARNGRGDEAIRAAWLATDLFNKATAEAKPATLAGGRSAVPLPAVPATSAVPGPAGLPGAAPPPTKAEARPPEQRPEPTPPPVVTSPPPVAVPSPTPAAPPETVTPVRPAQPPPAAPPSPTLASETSAIRSVLQAYVDAYSRLDPGGVKRVHPSVNEQALTQAFSGYRSQQVQIRDERIMVTGTTAVVTCTLDTNFVPKVGAPQRVALKVTLRLQKAGGAWIIVDRR